MHICGSPPREGDSHSQHLALNAFFKLRDNAWIDEPIVNTVTREKHRSDPLSRKQKAAVCSAEVKAQTGVAVAKFSMLLSVGTESDLRPCFCVMGVARESGEKSFETGTSPSEAD